MAAGWEEGHHSQTEDKMNIRVYNRCDCFAQIYAVAIYWIVGIIPFERHVYADKDQVELPYTLSRFDHCGQNDITYWRNIIHSYNQHLKAMNESYWIDTININHGREKTLSTWLTKIWSS